MFKLAFLVTEDWVFISHRLPLALAARGVGLKPVVITRCRDHRTLIESHGFRTINYEMNRRGVTPFGVFIETIKLWQIYRKEKPDVLHHIALRPVVVGGLAAKLSGQRCVLATLTGLGFLFTGQRINSFISRALGLLLPWLLSASIVVVQNTEDFDTMSKLGVPQARLRLIRGSGVNTDKFQPAPLPDGPPIVMLHARMLWDKGVKEFVEAAKILINRGSKARFVLIGEPDPDNPATVPLDIWDKWKKEGVVECWGQKNEMAQILTQASIVCLPSYREGLPKSLLEALACGRPCVTTDASGCREAVCDGENGLIVPVRDAEALANAIERLLKNPTERSKMGLKGRQRALAEFDEKIIIKQNLDLYAEVLAKL